MAIKRFVLTFIGGWTQINGRWCVCVYHRGFPTCEFVGGVSYFIIYLEILVSDPYFFSTEVLGLYRRLFRFKDFLIFPAWLHGHWELYDHQWEINWWSETNYGRLLTRVSAFLCCQHGGPNGHMLLVTILPRWRLQSITLHIACHVTSRRR